MAIYNPKSLKAEEFINHEEILDTIRYAEENKHNLALIDEILAKARPVKSADGTQTHCAGLSHREASVLLACDIPEKVAEMYELAEEIKQAFYGNRIVMMHQGAAILDRRNGEKAATRVEDLLGLFNEISIECGN